MRSNAYALVAICVTLVALHPVLRGDWVNWDDPIYVLQNNFIHDFSFSGLLELFNPANRVLDTYTPLTLVSFAIDYRIAQDSPSWYHAVNLIFHLINVYLVYFFTTQITKRKEVAFFVSVLFGIHPLHVESVAWISERKDVLYSFFFLLSSIQFTKFVESELRDRAAYINSLLLALLSILAKPLGVALPLVFSLILFLFDRHKDRKAWLSTLPLYICAILFGIGATFIMDENQLGYSLMDRTLLSGHALWLYLVKSAVPFDISHVMGQKMPGNVPVFYFLTTALSIVLIGLVLWFGRNKKQVLFGFLFFLFTVLFSLHFLKVNSGIAYDRFTYIPFIGLFMVIGNVIYDLISTKKNVSKLFLLLISPAVLIYGYLAFQRSKVWKNDETLWTDVIEHNPQHKVAWCKRANYYAAEMRLEEAMRDQNECIQLNPLSGDGYVNRGNIYKELKNYDRALSDYETAMELAPNQGLSYSCSGVLKAQLGRIESGIVDLNKAVDLNPDVGVFRLNQGLAYELNGQYDLALEAYSAAIEVNEKDHLALKYRGSLQFILEDYPSALADLELAVELRPDFAVAWFDLSRTNLALGNRNLAYKQYRSAVNSGYPKNVEYESRLKRVEI